MLKFQKCLTDLDQNLILASGITATLRICLFSDMDQQDDAAVIRERPSGKASPGCVSRISSCWRDVA